MTIRDSVFCSRLKGKRGSNQWLFNYRTATITTSYDSWNHSIISTPKLNEIKVLPPTHQVWLKSIQVLLCNPANKQTTSSVKILILRSPGWDVIKESNCHKKQDLAWLVTLLSSAPFICLCWCEWDCSASISRVCACRIIQGILCFVCLEMLLQIAVQTRFDQLFCQ